MSYLRLYAAIPTRLCYECEQVERQHDVTIPSLRALRELHGLS